MSLGSRTSSYLDSLLSLMQCVGPVTAKRMFGGHGLFIEQIMIALIHRETLYLKVDPESLPLFEAEGMRPFEYLRQGKLCQLSYFQAPEQVFDSQEEMRRWGGFAYGAAMRTAVRKKPRGGLSGLKGVGPKTVLVLNRVGICTREEFEQHDPFKIYIEIAARDGENLNLLYALVGAHRNQDWRDVARDKAAIIKALQQVREASGNVC